MLARLAYVAFAAALVVGCYDVPQPACGFVCGPAAACPDDYTCNASDNRCHANSAPADLVCPGSDAGLDGPDDAPFLLDRIPVDGAANVPVGVTLTVVFSEPVTGVSATSFVLARAGDGAVVVGNVGYDVGTRTATFDPSSPLEPSTLYFATLTTDIRDLTGNPLPTGTSWGFTTGDMTPPMVTMTSPGFDATGIAVDTVVEAVFTEEVFGVSDGSFTLAQGGTPVAGSVAYLPILLTARFTPAQQLAADTVYTATLTFDIVDDVGNALVPVSWEFTTGADTVAPTVAMRTPAVGGTDIAVDTTVTATFSEPVTGVSTTSLTLEQAGTPVPATVAYASATQTATLTPDAPLAPATEYTVTLTGAIVDAATNALAGAPVTWTFTTVP